MKLRRTQTFSAYFRIGHFGFPIFAKIDGVLPELVKYEFDMGVGVTVT